MVKILSRGKWFTAWFCNDCDHRLSNHEKMYSHGRCPYCGEKGPGACTIVNTYSKAVRFCRTRPIWKIWGYRGFLEFKDEKND